MVPGTKVCQKLQTLSEHINGSIKATPEWPRQDPLGLTLRDRQTSASQSAWHCSDELHGTDRPYNWHRSAKRWEHPGQRARKKLTNIVIEYWTRTTVKIQNHGDPSSCLFTRYNSRQVGWRTHIPRTISEVELQKNFLLGTAQVLRHAPRALVEPRVWKWHHPWLGETEHFFGATSTTCSWEYIYLAYQRQVPFTIH